MANISSLHVLLWSPSSDTLHRETLDRTVEAGMTSFLSNQIKQDYIVIAAGDSYEEVTELRNMMVKAKKEAEQDVAGQPE